MSDIYYPTANEFIALPTITPFGDIERFNVISMADRGLLEVKGDPFLALDILINGEVQPKDELVWSLDQYWVPTGTYEQSGLRIAFSYVAPRDTKGWFLRVQSDIPSGVEVSIRLNIQFKQLIHSINESKPCHGQIRTYGSLWNEGLVMEFATDKAKLSFGFLADDSFDKQTIGQNDGEMVLEKILANGQADSSIYMGVGLDEVSATTQAIHMQRVTGSVLHEELSNWLAQRIQATGEAHLDSILNQNQFFNYFFATGKTLDTEETVFCTSRSSRYYVSAAYWDRDSLLWSFPALLMTDIEKAREALEYVFTRQIRNIGIHSRFIDGTVLEPGFEMDELCAPLMALQSYIEKTDDRDYLNLPHVVAGIKHIAKQFSQWKHSDIELYGTFLMPTDDMIRYPYLTYNNVLVWRSFQFLADLAERYEHFKSFTEYRIKADHVQKAVWQHCVVDSPEGRHFIWSTDLSGHTDFYDEPPGSLTLLAHLGFCEPQDDVFQNTLNRLYSSEFEHYFEGSNFAELGCTHADHPWILSVANSLLNGRKEAALDILRRTRMDNYIACESIDETTGEWKTGAHFATCAGFLVYALSTAVAGELE